MQQIVPPSALTQKILGQQKVNKETQYRLSKHCMVVERPEGVLFYLTLTGELLLLSREEAALLEELPGPVPLALEELAPRWFLRPENADDMALADQVQQIAEHFKKKRTALTTYSIFTTTACNARCFYCFEAGWKNTTMTEQTARDTAAYIAAHRGGKPVRIHWFGGEPLVNTKAINVITDSLRRQGVAFLSTMASNGYLFDLDLVTRAKEAWNLQQVQIAMDGTEGVYNARKAYVHPEGSPYQRVLRNIGLLLDAGIRVIVRLNMDKDNEQDLYALIDDLAARFRGETGFGVYLAVLFENAGTNPTSYSEAERRSYAEKLLALQDYTERSGVMVRLSLKKKFTADSCMADSDNATTVTPEGKLGRCEECKDSGIWGSIYSEERDEEVLRQWKERTPLEEACQDCIFYPKCLRLKNCPGWPEHCSPLERTYREDRIRRTILGTYEEWKAAGQV